MTETFALGTLALAAVLVGWLVRYLVRRVEDAQTAAAHSHLLAVLERERCERLAAECRGIRDDCHLAASAAHDAAADAEEFVESVELEDDEDDDGYDRPRF